MKRTLTLNEKIASLAKNSGVSQAALAEKIGVPASHINHYFRGKGDIRSELFVEILKELNINIEFLINKETARLNNIDIDEQSSAGNVFEKLMKAFDKTEKEAILDYLTTFASANLGKAAKQQTKLLKRLI